MVTLGKIAVSRLVTCTLVPVAIGMHTVTTAEEHIRSQQPETADFPQGTLTGRGPVYKPSARLQASADNQGCGRAVHRHGPFPTMHDVVRLRGRRRGGDVDDRRP
ncbi:hypothetical protein GCM10010269_49820 [Streptomyces humidus]|uniref:Uncharacterized protein n=1 Tax=Streptomyces humidus TaxID=52259 RepID=A0A918FYK7_9ACTN|nr:hypothetical protein GCM10010269_49820 [Streptomyces humidus]